MLWMYMAMLETAEQKDKIAYIYENYAGMMYHVAIGVVGEHYLAEDAVHETFLRLIRKWKSMTQRSSNVFLYC